MRIIRQFLSDIIFWVMMYLAFIQASVGAGRVLIFFVILIFIGSISAIAGVGRDDSKIVERITIPKWQRNWVNYTAVLEACAFVWFGWIWTGIIYFLAASFMEFSRDELDKKNEEKA